MTDRRARQPTVPASLGPPRDRGPRAAASSTRPASAPATWSISDGRVVAVGPGPRRPSGCSTPRGCLVAPGLVDLHTHLRQPGKEEAETIETGAPCRGARRLHRGAGHAQHHAADRLRRGGARGARARPGARCATCTPPAPSPSAAPASSSPPWPRWPTLGVRIFTDDGTGVQDDRLMRRALEYAAGLDVTLAQHCEVTSLSEGTCMHEGEWSARLGLPGQPSEAEELMVMRDIALARLTGATHALPAHVDRRVGGHDRRGQGRRHAGHGRGGPAPLHPHRRLLRRLRRHLQGAPAAAQPTTDVAAIAAGLADGSARRHRHRPRPPRPRGEGAPLRPGAAGHAGPRVRPGAGLHPAGRRRRRCRR